MCSRVCKDVAQSKSGDRWDVASVREWEGIVMKTRFRTRRPTPTAAAWLLLVLPVLLVAGSLLTAVQTVEGG